MTCAGLFPRQFAGGTGRQKNTSLPVDACERKGASRARGGLQHSRWRLAAETAIEDAQYCAGLCGFKCFGQVCHWQSCALKICHVGVEQHQAAVGRTMTRKTDNDHVIRLRGQQSSKDGPRNLRMCRCFVDQQPRRQTVDCVCEQRPQRHRIASGAAQLRHSGVQMLVDADEDCLECHAPS